MIRSPAFLRGRSTRRFPFHALLLLLFAAVGAHAQTCLPPVGGDWTAWLNRQEAAGGHTLACHVNVSVNGLIGRIENRGGNQSGVCLQTGTASSWSGPQSLISVITPIIQANAQAIATGPAGDSVYTGRADDTIGTSVTAFEGKDRGKNRNACPKNDSYVCATTRTWRAIVRKTATDCFLLTAFPT
ncbi:MAG TPA: hypothetical protein VKB34_18095 [Povalibacter sp.]|nr:hypothetical protein [Povalibacter sp.]